MTRATLLALAARCEAATGPDRELDAETAVAAGWARWLDDECLAYTASLDAAVSLVPAGWTGSIYLDGRGTLYRDDRWTFIDKSSATPALALCVAAQRCGRWQRRRGMADRPLCCLFCHRPETVLKLLITEPKIYICDECVALCVEIVAEHTIEDHWRNAAILLDLEP